MQEAPIAMPACFSPPAPAEKDATDSEAITKSGQTLFVTMYRTKLAGECRLITVTWCKNLLVIGLSISILGLTGELQCNCKLEMKPWSFWKKQGSKRFNLDEKEVYIFWDLRSAKFTGNPEPKSDYYVAMVCDSEVVLLVGDLKKEAFRKTGSRPSLIDPILISRKEHIFGKRKFSSRVKLHERGNYHEISIECNSQGEAGYSHPEMAIKVDGHLAFQVKNLQWKFRGNECISIGKVRVEVYWDVHDWIFSSGLKHALFIFKSTIPTTLSSSSSSSSAPSTPSSTWSCTMEGNNGDLSSGFCLFLYAWKVE